MFTPAGGIPCGFLLLSLNDSKFSDCKSSRFKMISKYLGNFLNMKLVIEKDAGFSLLDSGQNRKS